MLLTEVAAARLKSKGIQELLEWIGQKQDV